VVEKRVCKCLGFHVLARPLGDGCRLAAGARPHAQIERSVTATARKCHAVPTHALGGLARKVRRKAQDCRLAPGVEVERIEAAHLSLKPRAEFGARRFETGETSGANARDCGEL